MSPSSPHTTLPSPSSLSQPATASASAAAPDSMTIQPPATAPSALLASANPAESPISQFRSLSDIYANPTGEQARWEHLINTFEERHGRKPSHVVRAPGRCNVLGEHVDYSLFPVLPAAIEQDILFAISPTSSPLVNISNIQTRFKPASIPLIRHKLTGAWDVELDSFEGWESYMKAVLKQGLATYFSGRDGKGPVGMDIVVSGNVPPGSGLSSSAAFVVAGMLSFLTANNLATGLRMNDLVQLAIASEHRMGVQTGGMDQAASVLGQKSSLSHISFHPTLSSSPVQISPRIAIVITNSLSPHSLGDSAARQYNLRVVETCLAARSLAHAWGLGEHPVVKVESKARVRLMEVLALKRERDGERGIEEMMRDVEAVLGRDGRGEKGWTREEMRAASGMKGEDFDRVYFGTFLRVEADHFHLLRRTRHILLENERVSRFCHLSSTSSTSPSTSSLSEEDTLAEFGALLNASHASCAGDYDCTVPQTDALQALCVRLGSLGSRQTGGGWGGAVISLVKVEEADAFLESVKREYGPYKGLKEEEVRGEAFVTRPGMGAGVYTYTGHVL